jgi:hypothetical protein
VGLWVPAQGHIRGMVYRVRDLGDGEFVRQRIRGESIGFGHRGPGHGSRS